jgi:hypothetical protein
MVQGVVCGHARRRVNIEEFVDEILRFWRGGWAVIVLEHLVHAFPELGVPFLIDEGKPWATRFCYLHGKEARQKNEKANAHCPHVGLLSPKRSSGEVHFRRHVTRSAIAIHDSINVVSKSLR